MFSCRKYSKILSVLQTNCRLSVAGNEYQTVKLPPDKVVGNFRECNASGKNNRFSKFFQHWMRLIIIGGSLLMRSLVCQNCSYQKFVQHSNSPSKAKILNFKISNIFKKFEISGLGNFFMDHFSMDSFSLLISQYSPVNPG